MLQNNIREEMKRKRFKIRKKKKEILKNVLKFLSSSSGRYMLSYMDKTSPLLTVNKRRSKINMCTFPNRPLALRGHVTNAFFKQRVGILLMPKIDRAHKNNLTPEIWKKTHLREIFYGTLIFQQSSMIFIGRRVGGHTLALQHGGQNYFLLISC